MLDIFAISLNGANVQHLAMTRQCLNGTQGPCSVKHGIIQKTSAPTTSHPTAFKSTMLSFIKLTPIFVVNMYYVIETKSMTICVELRDM